MIAVDKNFSYPKQISAYIKRKSCMFLRHQLLKLHIYVHV